MVSEWRDVALEDVAEELTVGYVGSMASEYVDEGVPFLRSLNVDPLRINKNDLKFISPEFHSRIRKSRLTPGDVVIVRTGKPGACSVVPEWLEDANCSDLVIVRCGPELDNRFLAYYVNTVACNHVAAHLVGAVQQHFNVGSARTLRLNLPPLAEQKAIAGVLGALDDKIELNRQMNATLEAMARALFQSWFVDFDPVRAKLDGRHPPHLDPATAALFPDSFDHSPYGTIPSGWRVARWGELATLEYGKSIRDYRESRGRYRVFGTNGAIGFHDESLCKSEGIVIGRKGAYRGVHYSPEPFFVIDTAFYLSPKATLDLMWAYYELLRVDINSMDSGSAIPSTSRDDFYGIPVIVPPIEIQGAFGKIIGRWYAKGFANDHESRILTTLRGTLLPKLLSGELTVSNSST